MNESRINLDGMKADKTEETLARGANQITDGAPGPQADEIADCVSQGRACSPAISDGGASRPQRAAGILPASPLGTDAEMRKAESDAALFREFDFLIQAGHSLNQAATLLGKSPSRFSGADSPYARWKRLGLPGLLPRRGDTQHATRNTSPLTQALEALSWFIPAAKYFNLNLNRTWNTGSVPEAIRRTISLPNVPVGWTNGMKEKFLAAINRAISLDPRPSTLDSLPTFPADLREMILAREKQGMDLVPERIARQIAIPKSVAHRSRSPRDWSLDTLSAPGSQRRYFSASAGGRVIMAPGDWFGGDDATPGIAVCVPCSEVITPCSMKFGVLLGRFQWLVFNDCRTDKILAWDYVVRPRGSYRAEDLMSGMGTTVRTHGIPRCGWQFEGGTFNAKLVQQAIKLMNCEHWRTYSPHQKAIESVFNRVWTRLALQFPHADMGRFRNENESNCNLYENCKKGHADPRRYFPTIDLVVKMFDEEVAAHNTRMIRSEQYGQWIPDELFATGPKRREFSFDEMGWIFSPFACERKITGMMVRCRVPMFEDFSVPFEFNAPWMPLHQGKKVRMHFNPREPKCTAKIVLLENSGQNKPGDILGDAQLIGETTGHIRLIMSWADDNQQAGYIARQKTNHFMRRITRGIGTNGRVLYAADEQRDGLGRSEKAEVTRENAEGGASVPASLPQRAVGVSPAVPTQRSNIAQIEAELAERERKLSETATPLDFL